MKRALVTGGCGFIGSNLTKELVSSGWQVDVVDNMSNGHLELLDGLKFRTVPNASFIGGYYAAYENANKARPQEEVLVIQDDFASDAMCLRIASKYYDNVFHLAAVPRVSYSVEHPYQTTHENISKKGVNYVRTKVKRLTLEIVPRNYISQRKQSRQNFKDQIR